MILLKKGLSDGVGDGGSVGALQQSLAECGYEIDQSELTVGYFGESTDKAVRDFQASHLGTKGKPLSVDGLVGADTQWALKNPSGTPRGRAAVDGWRCEPSKIREAVRRVIVTAVNELGVAETKGQRNRGPRVDVYTKPRLGIPWCAAFASFCFEKGCDGGSPFGRIDSSWGLYEWAERKGRVIYTNHPDCKPVVERKEILEGDIFLILRGSRADKENRRGHTGIICYVGQADKFCTIAGNESDCVRGGIRTRAGVSAIIRPVPLI